MKQLRVILIFAVSTSLSALQSVQANPKGATVVNGQVSFSQPDLKTLIINNSANAIINWQQFDIGANELTKFIQQNGSSAVLNRVISGDISEILGKLQSNGKVFLINPNGLVIGQNAVINTAGFIGSTLNISNEDFLNGRLHFEGQNAGDIDNQGFIRAGNSGDILLIAPNINNSGVLQVDGGNILLAAGESVTIANLDDADISFEVQSPTNSITNLGQVIADNGAANLFAGTLTHSGSISANGITQDAAGNIRLVAQDTNWIEGEITATGKHGGDIQLLGEQVGLVGNAMIDASGTDGGGQILIGGDYQGQGDVETARATYIGEDVQVKADAIDQGDGGKVIIWSDEATRMYGAISATGGGSSGDGGLIETSGGYLDLGNLVPDVSAVNGEGGTWLIDPYNITIVSATPSSPFVTESPSGTFESTADDSEVSIVTIAIALAGGDVIVKTGDTASSTGQGNITWNSDAQLDFSGFGNGKTLTLEAHNDVVINGQTGGFSNGTIENINLTINADSDNDGQGAFILGSTADLFLSMGSVASQLNVNAGSGITLLGNVNTSTQSTSIINLNSDSGIISSTGFLTTETLNLSSTSMVDASISNSATVVNLSANMGAGSDISYTSSNGINLAGITTVGGMVTIDSASSALTQSGAIVAGILNVAASQDVFLTNSANDVDIIRGSATTSGGFLTFDFVDTDDLIVEDINIQNNSTSSGFSSLSLTSGGDMTLNGNISAATTDSSASTDVTLNAQNGSNIIYQSGSISAESINFQNDGGAATTGAVGNAANPVRTAALSGTVNISIGGYDGEVIQVPTGGGDLFLTNFLGDVDMGKYAVENPGALQIQNLGGNIDFTNAFIPDASGSGNPLNVLTATSIDLRASGNLVLDITPVSSVVPLLLSTTGDIHLEGQNLTLNQTLDTAGNITLVSNSLGIQNDVTSSAGNVELRSDAFNISSDITAKNQVVVREYSAVGGLEVNNGAATSGFATLTTTDLGHLTGTDLGVVLGNDLMHSGTKSIQVNSNIDSSMINGPALTFDTTVIDNGSSTALINASIDLTGDNENLIFTGNGTALIQPTVGSGDITIDTGTGNFTSQVNQISILGAGGNEVLVNTNNADITGNLSVGAGTLAGSAANFRGNDLTVIGDVSVIAAADATEIVFLGDVDISSAQVVSVSGGTGNGASAKLIGGNINIVADEVIVSGGEGDFSVAEIGSLTGGSTTIDTTAGIEGSKTSATSDTSDKNALKGGDITLVAGTGIDADALITAGGGDGVAILKYGSCVGCNTQLFDDPTDNGGGDVGIYAAEVILNGAPINGAIENEPAASSNLDPIPELFTLLDNFLNEYVVPVIGDEDEDDELLLVCK